MDRSLHDGEPLEGNGLLGALARQELRLRDERIDALLREQVILYAELEHVHNDRELLSLRLTECERKYKALLERVATLHLDGGNEAGPVEEPPPPSPPLSTIEDEVLTLKHLLAHSKAAEEAARQAALELRVHLDNILNSRIWRYSAPLRKFVSLFYRNG